MVRIKHYTFMIVSVCFLIFLVACNNSNTSVNNKDEIKKENHNSTSSAKTSEEQEVDWKEVSKNGVDEGLLIKNIDKDTLTYTARQLQDLCNVIDKMGREDKYYWLKGRWYSDVVKSKQYNNVLSLGKKAMKPLFLIIYKSEEAGMYEWICSKALDDLSGFDFSDLNNGVGWSNSKEFLEAFIDKIIKKQN